MGGGINASIPLWDRPRKLQTRFNNTKGRCRLNPSSVSRQLKQQQQGEFSKSNKHG